MSIAFIMTSTIAVIAFCGRIDFRLTLFSFSFNPQLIAFLHSLRHCCGGTLFLALALLLAWKISLHFRNVMNAGEGGLG